MTTYGNLFIISAPSGAGKTSLVKALLEADPLVRLSVSYTTRAPRPGEVDGKDYHFISDKTFMEMLERGDFLESAEVYGNRYGTSQSWLETAMRQGNDIILEIDWQGACQVRKAIPAALGIFILPPSLAALELRLRNRQQDSDEIIARRLAAAKADNAHVAEFDYVIINNDFSVALRELHAVFLAARLTVTRQLASHAELLHHLT